MLFKKDSKQVIFEDVVLFKITLFYPHNTLKNWPGLELQVLNHFASKVRGIESLPFSVYLF